MAQKKFLIDGGFQVNDDSIISANLEMHGHIIPGIDSDGTTGYDLGSPTAKWRDLYLSQGSLYIDGQKVIESNAGTIVVKADPDQSLLTKTSGAGVLTFQSPNPIAIAGTLQMGTGKRITSADALAVVFGDKIDMDANQIINVANPTSAQHVATKDYVDTQVGNILNGAPAALDTLNELADALGNDANFASTITNALALKAATTYVDAQDATVLATAKSYTDTREGLITTAYQTYADAKVAAEATSRTSADATLQANIDAEETARETAVSNEAAARSAADATLQSNIDAEATARADADAALQAQIDSIVSNTDAAALDSLTEIVAAFQTADGNIVTTINANTTAIADETAARAAADSALETSLTAYVDAQVAAANSGATADFDSVTASLNSEVTRATGAESQLQSNIDAEATARTDADAALQAQIDSFVSNTDPVALDSLAEIVTAFQQADSDLNGAITTLATDATTARNALETSLRAYADTAEADAVSTAAADATAKADAAEAAAVSTAAADATSKADAAEAAAVSTANAYTNTRETAITTAYQSYADQSEADAKAYTDARETAITTAYQSYADTAEADAKAYTDARETAITTAYQTYADVAESDAVTAANTYTNTREAAITTAYQTYADAAEADAKSYADGIVATESSARASGDAALQAQIDSIISNTDPAALDSLTEIVAAFQAADSSLDGAISALGTAASTAHSDLEAAIAAEATARAAADTSLDTSLKAYTDNAIAAATAASVSAGYDLSANTTDDVTEGSTNLYFTDARAQSAVAGDISSAVAAEAATRSAADATLQSNIDAEAATRTSADATLQSNIDDVATDLSTETAARTSADATLQSNIDTKLASASYTAADVLAKIKTVDGAGSGLDADLLDGQSSAYYATAASVTSEASTRAAADSALDTRLTTAEGEIDTLQSTYVAKTSAQALHATDALRFGANTLSLYKGDGTFESVDLSLYVDDTNLARIVSGTMASNGIATFTRDDATSFTVDMSVLLDDTNLSRIVSATWNTGSGVLTLTRNDATTVTVDLDDRYSLGSHTHTLEALSNVSVSGNTNGEILRWNGSDWVNNTLAEAGIQPAGSYLGSTANAVSASKLATARTIALSGDVTGSVSFDGSANVSITATVADDSHNHTIANVDGLQTALDGKSATSHNHTLDSLSNTTITSNSAGEILKWNGTAWVNNTLAEAGIQPAGSYLGSTANAVSASKWATARTITLAGDASGSVSIDGSANVTLTVAVANDSHTHDTRYVQPSQLTHFHSAVQTVTSTQASNNASATVGFTFSELSGAKHYAVYMNRMLLRPTEYSVSGTTVTIAVGVLATGDDLEVTGLKI